MRYGYWTPVFGGWLRNVPDEGMEASWAYTKALTQNAERWGYDLTLIAELNLNDIKGVEQPALDAWSTAAALAAVTDSIELMVAVRPNFHHPALFAKAAANIDRISGGRLALNVVSSWWADEAKQYGLQFDQHDDRYARTAEWLTVVDGLWTEERFDFAGKFYTTEQAICSPKPAKRPTVYAGGESEKAKAMIAAQCDADVKQQAARRCNTAWPPTRSSATAKPRRSANSTASPASPNCLRAMRISTSGCRARSSNVS
jgi:FMNH2-dependent dimethyl sulfone monooxygenase